MARTERKAAEIDATGIGKSFGTFKALTDVTLTIARGEFLTLLGPSGSGKTTFLMVLSGFEPPTTGRLLLDGRDMTDISPEERGFGMVFQGYALFPHLTVEENIAFPLKVQRRGRAEIRRRVAEIIEMVGLGGHGHKRPAGLSGGQQQRVALARALAYEPPVMLFDEPFSALDRNLRSQMQDEMRRIHRETGTTFVFVTHDQEEALTLSSRIAIFEAGCLQQIGSPRDIYERPGNRFVAEFLGDINVLPIRDGKLEGREVTVQGDPDGDLAIRPEYMRIALQAPAEGNAVAARLTDLTYLGGVTRLNLRTAGGAELVLSVPTAELSDGLTPGAEIWATWPGERAFML
ncbi:ABC transporter ATP-binding protein [Paracoccus methylarcula]|uniref:ABC transporter ATP-binding protein n=1 Tax=Paracoccus methylarcula TaxID=72022 RepID=A0A3R7SC04_9RHOB|nr:ABC transporter ATP-binding protein [Paracoccus methylarcula]RNF33302.1 ABC transporter ATP-binding protein [Paracoccus methylarcula]